MLSLLPLFPLNAILVPGLVLPLHIFEPRYLGMVADLLAIADEEKREFGLIAVRAEWDVQRDGIDALYSVGTTAILRKVDQLPDGRLNIVTTGGRRFRVHSIDTSQPLVSGMVEFLEDVTSDADTALARKIAQYFAAYRLTLTGQVAGGPDSRTELDTDDADELPDDPTVLSYLVTAAMLLAPADRQQLLAADSVSSRLRAECVLLRRETALISTLGALPWIDAVGARTSPN